MEQTQTQETPTQETPTTEVQTGAPSISIPDEYKEAKWAQNLKSDQDLWKEHANLQSLMGKRPAGIPANDAPDEEWQKFYESARPEAADKYEFSEVEGLPEGVDLTAHTDAFKNVAFEAGLTPKQADMVRNMWLKHELGSTQEQQAALDAKYEEVTKQHLSGNVEEAEKRTMELASQYVPDELREGLTSLSDNPVALAAMLKFTEGVTGELDEVKKKYGVEGSLSSGAQTPSQSIDDIRTELAKLNVSPANKQFDHPDHNKTRERITQLRESLQRGLK